MSNKKEVLQSEVAEKIENLIPKNYLIKYTNLTYAEMAEQPDMAEWKEALLKAETDWWEAEDA